MLGLTKTASEQNIKNMYYKLCYEYHPDRAGGVHQDKFKEITAAYQVIGDKDKKKQYDELREEILTGKKKDSSGRSSGSSSGANWNYNYNQ